MDGGASRRAAEPLLDLTTDYICGLLSSTMGFLWSGPRASVAGIFRRSARYWITSWVGNCLWGSPGQRGPRNPSHPEHAAWKQAQAQREVAAMDAQSAAQKARRIGRDMRELGHRLGWTEEAIAISAEVNLRQELGVPLYGGPPVMSRTTDSPETSQPTRAAAWVPYQGRPAAVSRAGGLRSGASLCGVAHPRGAKLKRGAAIHSSGGLRGGAAKRWAR